MRRRGWAGVDSVVCALVAVRGGPGGVGLRRVFRPGVDGDRKAALVGEEVLRGVVSLCRRAGRMPYAGWYVHPGSR